MNPNLVKRYYLFTSHQSGGTMRRNQRLISTISSKGQVTIPAEIRSMLHLRTGDAVQYLIEGNIVTIKKATTIDLEWARALETTMTEWSGTEDDDL